MEKGFFIGMAIASFFPLWLNYALADNFHLYNDTGSTYYAVVDSMTTGHINDYTVGPNSNYVPYSLWHNCNIVIKYYRDASHKDLICSLGIIESDDYRGTYLPYPYVVSSPNTCDFEKLGDEDFAYINVHTYDWYL